MTRNLDVNLLRAFAIVADLRSMTAAANALHLSQGAISQQIARLEALVGTPLLTRERRGMRVTPAGERLLGKARQFVALNDAIWSDLNGGAIQGSIRLGVPHDLMGSSLPPILKAFAQACPQVEVTLVSGSSPDLAKALANGELDLAIIEELPGSTAGELLALDRLVWVGARSGQAHKVAPLPMSLVADTCAFKPIVAATLRRHRLEWRAVFENGGFDATLAMVRIDMAVAAMLATTVPGDLDIIPPEAGLPVLPSFAINLHLPDHRPTSAVNELVRLIREGFARPRQTGWDRQPVNGLTACLRP